MHAYTVKFNLISMLFVINLINLLTCLYVCLVHTTVFMNITMYILISYTAVILISTYQAIFVIDNGSEYLFRLMPAILIPLPDIHVQIYCL